MSRRVYLAVAFATVLCTGASRSAVVPVFNTNDNLAGSLRQAIQDASPGDTIVFQIPTTNPGFNPNTGIYTIGLTSGELVINKDLTIDPAGQKITVQRNSGNFRVFNVTTGQVTILALTIRNGRPAATTVNGGGILNNGNLTVKICTFIGNDGDIGGSGGGIHNTGTLRVSNCTFFGNLAGVTGTAIANFGDLTLENSTIVGGAAPSLSSDGAGVHGGSSATTRVRNTIIVGNTRGAVARDVSGTFISEGYNLIGSTSGSTGFGSTGDQLGASTAQASLGPLQNNGGPALTMRPIPGSVAIDQGKRGLDANGQPIDTDQRDYPRPVDLPIPNAVGGDGSDIGAVETAPSQAGPDFLVTNTDDHLSPGDNCTVDDCTFREAISTANGNPDANTITFANGVGPVIVNQTQTSGYPIFFPVTITGPGARKLAISGVFARRIFDVTSQDVVISGLKLREGVAEDSNGGAIANTGGLTLTDCTVIGSLIVNNGGGGGNGGGLFNASGATAVLSGCTFNINSANQFGGGAIFNAGHLTATNCTFSHNTAPSGGAILSVSDNGNSLVTLQNCTITSNTATSTGGPNVGGGGYYGEGGVGNSLHHFSNTILAGNSNANNPDLRGFGTSEGNNLIGNLGQGGSGFTNGVNGDIVGVSAQFAGFTNFGGQTDTWSLQASSPAIDSGNDALAPPTDQRGFGRNGVSDIGAFEFDGTPPLPPQALSAVSRKIHGGSGTLDIDLLGAQTECRGGGASEAYQVVIDFASAVTFDNASITSGAGMVSAASGQGTSSITLELTGVTNAQNIVITLTNVDNGSSSGEVSVPMSVLVGDTNNDTFVNSGDAIQTRNRSGQTTDATNFRSDVNADGVVNSGDTLAVRNRSGTFLP